MQILNFFKINSLKITDVFKITLILNVFLILFTKFNIDFLFFTLGRYIFTFFYITFIPGIYLLRVLKLRDLDNYETFFYSIGLSLASLMLIGLSLNIIGSYYNLYPITLNKLIISLVLFVFLLSILIYYFAKEPSNKISYVNIPLNYMLYVISFILISIVGAYYLFFYNFNIILIIMYLLISVIPILLIFKKNINKHLYIVLIFSITLSLLFSRSLLSTYISGWDIQQEYYLSSLVIKNGFWNSNLGYDANGMLSIVMLAPIYSIIMNVDLIEIFKVIYPLLFSLVPCCLFFIFKKQFNEKIAFLSCFFIISLFTFYWEMPQLGRQEIAELFFVLVIYVFTNNVLTKEKKSFLLIIFLSSLAVSHYGLSYFTIYFLVSMLIIRKVLESKLANKIFYRVKSYTTDNNGKILDFYVVTFFIIITITWNLYTANAQTIKTIFTLSNRFWTSLLTEFLNPSTSQALTILITSQEGFTHQITQYLFYGIIFLITIGILNLLINYRKMELNNEYKALSIANFFLCMSSIVLPYVSNALDTTRLFHITTLTLAPYLIIGAQSINSFLKRIVQIRGDISGFNLKVVSIFLCIFMLFNSGWVYQVTGDHPTSYLFNNKIDNPIFNEMEITGAKWWNNNRIDQRIYADQWRWLLLESINLTSTIPAYYRENSTYHIYVPINTFIYLGTYNIQSDKFLLLGSPGDNVINTQIVTSNSNKIYSNSYCDIYLK